MYVMSLPLWHAIYITQYFRYHHPNSPICLAEDLSYNAMKSWTINLLAVASWQLSSEVAIDVTSALWNGSADTVCIRGFHMRIVLSRDVEQMVPSRAHASVVTLSECPVRQHSSLLCHTATRISVWSCSKQLVIASDSRHKGSSMSHSLS